jgi:pentatricopeptide repeat protein
MSDALEAFKTTPARNIKSWNMLIDGFVQNQMHQEALTMFEDMLSNTSIQMT